MTKVTMEEDLKITLRAARVNIGYTLKEASLKFGIHFETLAKYELDSTNVPRGFFTKIEEVYGIPVENIYFGKMAKYQNSLAKQHA